MRKVLDIGENQSAHSPKPETQRMSKAGGGQRASFSEAQASELAVLGPDDVSEFAPVREFKLDLGAARIAGADATGRTGVGVGATLARLPLPHAQRVAPQGSRQQGRYMPMLKLGH